MNSILTTSILIATLFATQPTPPPSTESLTTPPTPTRHASDRVAMKMAIDQIRPAAAAFSKDGILEDPVKPTFADSFEYLLDDDTLIDALLKKQDRKSIACDAYIKWELLSFNPDLSNLDNRTFDKLLATLPAFVQSPAADPAKLKRFEKLAYMSGRDPQAAKKLQSEWDVMRVTISQQKLLNVPATQFREILLDQMPLEGPRRIRVMLQWLADNINAGIDTRSIKSAITKELKTRRIDETLTDKDRWNLIYRLETLAAKAGKTTVIRDIILYIHQSGEIKTSTLEISQSNIDTWSAYLTKREP